MNSSGIKPQPCRDVGSLFHELTRNCFPQIIADCNRRFPQINAFICEICVHLICVNLREMYLDSGTLIQFLILRYNFQ